MKNLVLPRLASVRTSALALALLTAPQIHAATYYWDANDSTAGFGTAGGIWAAPTTNNATQGWSTSSAGTNVMSGTTNTTTADALNFGTGSAGLAVGTITVSGNVSAGGITFGNANGNITLSGGSITLNGLLYRLGSAATTQTINSDIVLVGARQFGANQVNEKLVFGGNISGSGASLTLDTNASGGLITLNGTNSFSGNLSMVRGQLNINSVSDKLTNSALGAGSKIIVGAGGGQGPVLNYTGSSNGSTNRDLELNVSGGGSLTITSQNAALTLSGTAMNTVASATGILKLSGDAGGGANINHYSGAIQDNGNSTMSVQLLAVTPTSGSLEHGFWKLSGNNTYSGTTTVTNVSTLIVGHSNALGTTENGTSVEANSQLLLEGGIAVGPEALTLNAGAASSWNGQTGAALRSYSGNNSWAGAITLGQATTIATNSGAGLTLSGGIGGNFNLTFNSIGNTIASGNITIGAGTLTKSGIGNLTLSGNNTYSGTTTINAGALEIEAAGRLGGGSYAATITNNGTLIYSGTNSQDLSGAIGGTGALTHNASSTLTLSNNNTYAGATTINAGTIEIGAAGRLGGGSYAGAITNNGTLIYSGTNSQTLSGAIGGTGALTHNVSSTLTLTNNNTYAGATTINAGTIEIGAAGRLGGGSYAGAITNNGTLIYSGTGNQTLSGAIGGNGALTHNASSTLTLTNNNTYAGATTINAGTLKAGSTTGFSSRSAVTVAAGATLDLGGFNNTISSLFTATGTITDSSSVGNGGNLRILSAMPSTASAQLFTGSMGLQLFGGSTTSSILTNTSNTYSGGTVFGNGTGTTFTRLFASGTIGSGSPGAVTSGIYGKGAITLGASTSDRVQIYFAGTTTINNNLVINSEQGNTGELGALRVESSGSTIAGAINTNLADLKINAMNAAGRTITITGAISGNYGVNIMTANSGALEVTLNNAGTANSYAGNTTISTANATLTLGRANQISNGAGKGNLIINSGTFKMGGFNETINGLAGNGAIDGVSGTPTLSIGDNDANATFSGLIKNTSGSLAVAKIGSGTLALSGNNTYSGGTTLNTGTLVIGHANAAGAGTITQSNSSSVLKIDTTGTITNAMSVYNVQASQNATLSGAITVNNATWDVDAGDTLAISGNISGTGGTTKNGTGTLVLSGNNSNTGATTVNAGTLTAASTDSLGATSGIVMRNGGSLLVTAQDAINDSADVTLDGGTLAVDGTFSESVGLLTLSANSVIDLNRFTGTLRFAGLGAWASGAVLSIWNWNGINQYGTPVGDGANNRHVVFTDATGLGSYLDRISFYSGSGSGFAGTGFEEGFTGPGGGTVIGAVPEPGVSFTAAFLIMLCVGLWMRRNLSQHPLWKAERFSATEQTE